MMKKEEAEKKVCPFLNKNCVTNECMFWISTIEGKKEIARFKMPYDIYPRDEGAKHRELLGQGYVETSNKVYIKYEEAYEGYCNCMFNREGK